MQVKKLLNQVMLALGLGVVSLYASISHASIFLSGTRLIVDEAKQEATITVRNGDSPVLVQSWLDAGDEVNQQELPFAVVPPLSKVNANAQQLLRVMYAGLDDSLPKDRESVYWLNVQEIPQTIETEQNQLQIAVRQRIKVFFRPDGIRGNVSDGPNNLTWEFGKEDGKNYLIADNNSAYHVSLGAVVDSDDVEIVSEVPMINPYSKLKIELNNNYKGGDVMYRVINDFGAANTYKIPSGSIGPVKGVEENSKK